MTTKPKRGGPDRGQGRKPIHPEPMTKSIRFRATEAEFEKWHRLGGSVWNRAAINKAKET